MINFENPFAIKVRKQIVQALSTYSLIEEGDKVMVCVSGGKDSSVLLVLLNEIKRRAPYNFELEAVMLDQKQPGFDATVFKRWVDGLGIKLTILEHDTYSIVKEKVTSGVFCSMCSRLRRGILYNFASEKGFSKLALGHHRDDVNETTLLNLFYSGKLSAMPPKLKSDDGRNLLIRPMIFVAEKDVIELAKTWEVPIMPCNLCGSQDGLKRKRMKKLLLDLEKEIPGINTSILSALANVRKSQLLDRDLWNFEAL